MPKPETNPRDPGPNARLRAAREAAHKTPEQVALRAQISEDDYYDLEMYPEELFQNTSLERLNAICGALNIEPACLFTADGLPARSRVSKEDLSNSLKHHLEERGMTPGELEDSIGFLISDVLVAPELVRRWNVDCLKAVCQKIGTDWIAALQGGA